MAKPTSTGSRKSRLRLAAVLAAVAVGIVAALAGGAFADNTISDGDGLTPVANNDMAFGNVNCGVATNKTALIAISRNGNYSTSNVFKAGTTATISVNAVSITTGDGLSASMGVPTTISIPSDWNTAANNTLTAAVSSTVTVDSSTPGSGSGVVTYRATGTKSDGTTGFTRDDTMNVSWTVLDNCSVADTTAPSVEIALNSPNSGTPDGNNGWFKTGPVTGTVTATDVDDNVSSIDCTLTDNIANTTSPLTLTESGIGTSEATGDFSISTDGNYTISCTATDAHSNTTDPAVTQDVKLDTTPPSVSGAPTTDPNGNGWYNSNVTIHWTCSDTTSGVVSCPADSTISTEGTNETVNSGLVYDNAGNSNSADSSPAVNIDKTPPTVSVTGFTDGDVFVKGVDTLPIVGCSRSDSLSGIDASGSTGPTITAGGLVNGVGSVTYTCGAADNAGNTNTASSTYTVIYNFTGFFQPVNSDPGYCNTVKAGSAIPMKFSLGGYQGMATDIFQSGYPKATAGTCTGATSDPISDTETVTAGNSSLNYDSGADQYIYVWKTDKAWAGKAIRFTIVLTDGTTHYARFLFTK